jgi:sulfur-carrier protein
MAHVEVGAVFRPLVAVGSVDLPAGSVGELVALLEERYPKLKFRIRDESGELRRYLKIFVNGTEIRSLQGLSTPLAPSDRVDLLHSIQGG